MSSSGSGDDHSDEEGYTVERILDFDALEEKNYEGSEQLEEYDPSTGPTVWIIKYLVKWKDYESPEYDTWEPRTMFGEWIWDDHIKRIERDNPDHPTHQKLVRKIEKKNNKLREKYKHAQDKGKGKGKGKRGRSTSRQLSQSSSPPKRLKKRSTQNSASGLFDPNEMIQAGNAPSATSRLRLTSPPTKHKSRAHRSPDSDNQQGRSVSPVLAPVDHTSARSGSGSDSDASVANRLGRPQVKKAHKKKRPVIASDTGLDGDGGSDADQRPLKRPAKSSPAQPPRLKKVATISISSDDDTPAQPTTKPSPKRSKPQRSQSVPVTTKPVAAIIKPVPVPVVAPPPKPTEAISRPSLEGEAPPAKKARLVLEPESESDEDIPLAKTHSTLSRPSANASSSTLTSLAPDPSLSPPPPALPDPPSTSSSTQLIASTRSTSAVPEPAPKVVNLADEKLRIEFRQTDLSRKLPNKVGASIAEQVKLHWRVGGPDNIQQNVFDFEQLMKGKVAYIYAGSATEGIKSGVPGVASRAREVKADILALQLLLDSIPGATQVEDTHSSVDVVFVHARDRAELGKIGGQLGLVERLRSTASHAFIFGEAEVQPKANDPYRSLAMSGQIKKKWFRAIWTKTAAVTISPAALVEHSAKTEQVTSLLKRMAEHRSVYDGRRDVLAWAPASSFASGGGYEVRKLEGENDKPRALAVSAMHRMAREGLVTPTGPFPTVSDNDHLPTVAFPLAQDGVEYDRRKWEELDKWLPASLKVADLAGLLRDVALYKAQYCQVRRWIVIASGDEVASQAAASAPGVEVVTLAQAEKIARSWAQA